MNRLKSADSTEQSEFRARLTKVMRNIAGLNLAHAVVKERFINLFRSPKTLTGMLHQKQRLAISQELTRAGVDRENWIVGKLVLAIGKFNEVELSLISTCLCNDYLYDRTGRFCNPKTFRDFQINVDQDIQHLRGFIDPQVLVQRPAVGHVHRLMSFIREFLAKPQEALHQFWVRRTKAYHS